MENLTPGFHIECPMIHQDADAGDKLASSEKIGEYVVRNLRQLNYTDTFWDTCKADLYSSSRVLRTRARNNEIDFLDYKGPPRYLMQTLFCRPLFSEKISNSQDAQNAITLTRPSEPMQALYEDRVDLIGNPLKKLAICHVDRRNIDLFTSDNEGFCTISIHKYSYEIGGEKTQSYELIEIQPYCASPVLTSNLPKIFAKIKAALINIGWKESPTSKYHRIDRKIIDDAI